MPGSLVRAFAISIVLHAILLWPAVTAWREAAPAVPLVASLRPSSAPVVPANAPDILPKPAAKAPVEQRPDSKSVETMATPAERETRAVATVASTAAAGDRSGPETQPPIASALPPSSGLDADGLRSYRLALAREARRYKRYPARAIEAGWEGTVELRVNVSVRAAPTVQLAKSSGHRSLDESALEMLSTATLATPLPAVLKGQDFSVDLPIVFELPQ